MGYVVKKIFKMFVPAIHLFKNTGGSGITNHTQKTEVSEISNGNGHINIHGTLRSDWHPGLFHPSISQPPYIITEKINTYIFYLFTNIREVFIEKLESCAVCVPGFQ